MEIAPSIAGQRETSFAELKGASLSVYLSIALHCDRATALASPSLKTIEKETGYCRSTVIAAIRKLEEMGLIIAAYRKHDGRKSDSNLYLVRDCIIMGKNLLSALERMAYS